MSIFAKKSILLIDDDEELGEAVTRILQNVGIEVHYASSIIEGLKAIKTFSPHLILLDIVMPEMDGFTFLIKRENIPYLKEIPIIVSSNLNKKKHILHALSIGANDYLIKPFETVKLLDKIRKNLKDLPEKKIRLSVESQTVSARVEGSISKIGEVSMVIDSRVRLEPDQNIEVISNLFPEINLTNRSLVTSHIKPGLSVDDDFCNRVNFVGVDDDVRSAIGRLIRQLERAA